MGILKLISKNRYSLTGIIEYVMDTSKTEWAYAFSSMMGKYDIYGELQLLRQIYPGKRKANPYKHIVFSFDNRDVVSPYTALQVSQEIADYLSQGKYQVFGVVHYKEEKHIHSHFIIHAIGYDESLYRQNGSVYQHRQDINRILDKYMLHHIHERSAEPVSSCYYHSQGYTSIYR